MADNRDAMDIDSHDLTPPSSSGKRNNESSEDDLTPRKRPRTSFWPSKRPAEEQNVTCKTGTLEDLKAGIRSPPIEVRIVCKEVRARYLKLVVMDTTGERSIKAFGGCIQKFQHAKVNELYQIDGYNVQTGFKNSPDEIVLQSSSTMNPIAREDFPEVCFDFKSLKDLGSLPNNSIVDVVGIITNVEPVAETTLGIPKRELMITDSSKAETSIFFWKNDVGLCDNLTQFSPITIRFATKKSFGDEAVLWYTWQTQIVDNSTHEKAVEQMNWFREETAAENIQI